MGSGSLVGAAMIVAMAGGLLSFALRMPNRHRLDAQGTRAPAHRRWLPTLIGVLRYFLPLALLEGDWVVTHTLQDSLPLGALPVGIAPGQVKRRHGLRRKCDVEWERPLLETIAQDGLESGLSGGGFECRSVPITPERHLLKL